MRTSIILLVCMLAVLLTMPLERSALASAVPNLAQPAAGAAWQIATIVSAPGAGQSLALAVHPTNHKPYISYVDNSTADLKLAFPVSSGGDCGPGNTWSCNSLDHVNNESFGTFSSIDFTNAGNWGISYVQGWPLTGVAFHGMPVDSSMLYYSSVENAKYAAYSGTNFRYSLSDNGGFVYNGYNSSTGTVYLNYASYSPTAVSTCGAISHWDCEVVAKLTTGALFTTPAFEYMGDWAQVAFRDSRYGQLYFAARTGFSGDCPDSTKWVCQQVDRDSVVTGSIAMAIQGTSSAAIAYYDATTKYMIVATSTTGGCGWTCNYIEPVGASLNEDAGIDVALRGTSYIVAYTDRTNPNNTILKVAYPDPNGNCGPTVAGKRTWRCEVVDNGGGTKKVGKYLSMAVSASGVVYIAYSNDSDGGIMLATLNPPSPAPTPTPIFTATPVSTIKHQYIPVVKK